MSNIYLMSEATTKTIQDLNTLGLNRLHDTIYRGVHIPQIMFASLESDPEHRLGYFEIGQNLIILSKEFLDPNIEELRNNVFLHELAHCIDWYRNHSSAHDKTFREICEVIGVDPDFSYAVAKNFFEKKEKMQSKVNKLMALSQSDFEGEASLAIEKAQTLMEKYNLQYTTEDNPNEIFGVDVYSASRMDVWRTMLMGVISDITGAFRLTHFTNEGKTLSFFGSAEQCETALYLWEHFTFHVTQKFKELKSTVCGTVKPAQIHNGIVEGLHEKVRANSCKSLVISQEKNENLYCAITGARIRHTTTRLNCGSQYSAGKDAGSGISVPTGKGSLVKRIGYGS